MRQLNHTLRANSSKIFISSKHLLPYWVAAAITAGASVLYATAFRWSESFMFTWCEIHPAWSFLIVPMALVISTSLATRLSPLAAGSGIPQLLAAVEASHQHLPVLERILNFRMIVVKFFGSCLCVAGGGVTGREGPMLQISAAIFRMVQKFCASTRFNLGPVNLQSMVLAGGAAGLASAFNTPLGGVIFTIEELAKVHISFIRTYVFHAVIIAGLLAQSILGNYLYIGKITLMPPSPGETLLLIAAAGIIGALGAMFGKAIVYLLDFRAKKSAETRLAMTIACGFGVATLIYFFGRDAAGSGREVIVNLLAHSDSQTSLLLGLTRGLGNLLTYSAGVIGGVFAPALATGAALGSWMSQVFPKADHAIWILAGMIAFLTGLTRTPFTSLIIVIEMTDTHNIIISLMVAAIIAQSAAKLIDASSFYEQMSYRILHGTAPTVAVGTV